MKRKQTGLSHKIGEYLGDDANPGKQSKNLGNDEEVKETGTSQENDKVNIETLIEDGKKYESLVRNSLVFICYCSLLDNDYDAVTYYGNQLKKEFKLSKKTKFNTNMYLVEALIAKDMLTEAFDLLKKEMDSQVVQTVDAGSVIKVENTITASVEKGLKTQTVLFINMATVHFLSDNVEEAENCIHMAMDTLGISLLPNKAPTD